jgi:hypothetical protein
MQPLRLNAHRVRDPANREVIAPVANVVPADVAANHTGPIEDGAQHFLGERVLAEESMAPVAEVAQLPSGKRDAAEAVALEVGGVRPCLSAQGFAGDELFGDGARESLSVGRHGGRADDPERQEHCGEGTGGTHEEGLRQFNGRLGSPGRCSGRQHTRTALRSVAKASS